jgi:hypothetical protein
LSPIGSTSPAKVKDFFPPIRERRPKAGSLADRENAAHYL